MVSNILFEQFYTYIVFMIIGYFATKSKIITLDNGVFLSHFVLYITFPLLIFTTVTHMQFDINVIKNSVFVFVFSYIALFLLFAVGKLTSKWLSLQEASEKIHVLHSMFGNIVFIGFPFISSLMPGSHALLYAAVFQVAADSVLWTFGIYLIANKKNNNLKDNLKHLVNVNSIVFFVSLLMLGFGLKLPDTLDKPFSMLGHTTLSLSLVFVGHILSTIKIDAMVKKASLYALSFNKLILVPFIMLALIYALKPYLPFLQKDAVAALILQVGMPAMATIVILARKYEADHYLATENMFVTTIFSIFTLPLLWGVINYFF
jgi:predicted permease